jgi:hypothetical protein
MRTPSNAPQGTSARIVEAEDLACVLGLAGVVLLPVGEPDLRLSRHDHAGLGARDG